MTTLRISITKEVLEATKDCVGGCGIAKNCAISYAVREVWPTAETYLMPEAIIIGSYQIQHNQSNFIRRFDRATHAERAAMKPFFFEIEVPDEVIGEVNIEEIRDIIKNSKTLEFV